MKSIIVGTAGHIDHGKTALVKALTGIDADRLEEEKRRGITIDLGFAHLELPGLTEAVEKRDWGTAKQQAEILRQALVNNTKLVNELNANLKGETPGVGKQTPRK